MGSFGYHGFRCRGEVPWVGVYDDVIVAETSLLAGSNAVRAAVVGSWGEGAAVVVAKFYDYEIAGDELICDCREARFVVVGACRAATDSVVDYRYAGERVWKIDAPT